MENCLKFLLSSRARTWKTINLPLNSLTFHIPLSLVVAFLCVLRIFAKNLPTKPDGSFFFAKVILSSFGRYMMWRRNYVSGSLTILNCTVKCVETSLWHQSQNIRNFILISSSHSRKKVIRLKIKWKQIREIWIYVSSECVFLFSSWHRTTKKINSVRRHSTSSEGSFNLQLTLSKSSLINVSMLSLNFFQGFTFKFVLNELPQPWLCCCLVIIERVSSSLMGLWRSLYPWHSRLAIRKSLVSLPLRFILVLSSLSAHCCVHTWGSMSMWEIWYDYKH